MTYTPYPDRYAETCYSAPDHDTADLCAQWRAAIAAEKAVHEARNATFWATVSTLLSMIGVGGLIYTIWQTNGALGEARRGNRITLLIEKRARREARDRGADTVAALDIAKRSNEIAENNSKITLRAYLSLKNVQITGITPEEFSICFSVSNLGSTPASDVRLRTHTITAAQAGWEPDANFIYPDGPWLERDHSVTIQSGTAANLYNIYPIAALNQMRANVVTAIVYGTITYRDIFDDPQKIDFSYKYIARDAAAGDDIWVSTKPYVSPA